MTSILKANTKKLNHMYRPPFGYDVTEAGYLVPITEDLEQLSEIAEMIEAKALSFREGALWLSEKCSRSITYEGLRLRLQKGVELDEDAL